MNDREKPSLIGDVLFKGRKPGGIGGRIEEKSDATGGVGKKKARPLGEKGV